MTGRNERRQPSNPSGALNSKSPENGLMTITSQQQYHYVCLYPVLPDVKTLLLDYKAYPQLYEAMKACRRCSLVLQKPQLRLATVVYQPVVIDH